MSAGEKRKIELTMYGVAEVLKWCIQKNQGRIPGVDTEGFKKMQEALAQKPQVADYYTLDKFWKQKMVFEFTPEEIETINRCLYDIPNFDGLPLPQIRYKFWPPAEVGPPESTPDQSELEQQAESKKKEPAPG